MRRGGGLGARLMASEVVLGVVLLALGFLAAERLAQTQDQLEQIYSQGVVPFHEVGHLADALAIDYVDTVHKVCDDSMSTADGARQLERIEGDVEDAWRRLELASGRGSHRQRLSELEVLLREALVTLRTARAFMRLGDLDGLRAWRKTEMYKRVDPLTRALTGEGRVYLGATSRALSQAGAEVRAVANRTELAIVGVAALALALGLRSRWRMARSVRELDLAIQAGARGDLGAKVGVIADGALVETGRRLDEMLAALDGSQRELKAQAGRLMLSEAEARAAAAAKTAFLGNVSHELRTPLNVILGHAQVLLRDASWPSELRTNIERIQESGEHLLALIEDVLGMAGLDARALTIRPESVNVQRVLEEVERTVAPRARAKDLALEVVEQTELPPGLWLDPRRLRQVLLNLVGNAVKFTSRGGVVVRVAYAEGWLQIEVEDSGPGIGELGQAKLFEAFVQGPAGAQSGEGTGLGLHISRELARAMGGDLTLLQSSSRGTTFALKLEAARSEAPSGPLLSRVRHVVRPGTVSAPMLVVDDRAPNREVLSALLGAMGLQVVEAATGSGALELLSERPFAALWLDLKMPGMDGFEVCRRVREREALTGAHLPIIAVTASLADLEESAVVTMGFDGFLAKPVREKELEGVLTGVLSLSLSEVASQAAQQTTGDLSWMSADQKRALLAELDVGDHGAALALSDAWGAQADGLRAELRAFRGEEIRTRILKETSHG